MAFDSVAFAASPPFDQPLTPFQQTKILMGDSSDLLIWQDVFVHQRAVFSVPRSPPSPALSTIPEAREEADEQNLIQRRQFSRRLRAMSIDLTKEENKVFHSLGCRLKPVLAMDGGAPDPDLPQLDSVMTIKRISDLELDRWLSYYASDAAHAALVSHHQSRQEKEQALAQCIGVTGLERLENGADASVAEACESCALRRG